MLKVGIWAHLMKDVMAHVNTINDAVTTLILNVKGVPLALAGASNPLTSAHVNRRVTASHATANTVAIPDGLMTPGQWVEVLQIGAGATSITVSGAATINGAQTPIAVAVQKTIYCVAEDVYLVY